MNQNCLHGTTSKIIKTPALWTQYETTNNVEALVSLWGMKIKAYLTNSVISTHTIGRSIKDFIGCNRKAKIKVVIFWKRNPLCTI